MSDPVSLVDVPNREELGALKDLEAKAAEMTRLLNQVDVIFEKSDNNGLTVRIPYQTAQLVRSQIKEVLKDAHRKIQRRTPFTHDSLSPVATALRCWLSRRQCRCSRRFLDVP